MMHFISTTGDKNKPFERGLFLYAIIAKYAPILHPNSEMFFERREAYFHILFKSLIQVWDYIVEEMLFCHRVPEDQNSKLDILLI